MFGVFRVNAHMHAKYSLKKKFLVDFVFHFVSAVIVTIALQGQLRMKCKPFMF